MPTPVCLENDLTAACKAIRPLDPAKLQQAWNRIDSLTKPQGSLGRLEEIAARLMTIYNQGQATMGLEETGPAAGIPQGPDPARIFTVAGDHGVVAEGINAAPQEVTRQQVVNFLNGGGGINALCAAAGAELRIVDAGAVGVFSPHPLLLDRKIRQGTDNFAKGPAMRREECLLALHHGLELARDAANEHCRCLGIGEMGIGNTTPSAALFCAWLRLSPEEASGPGAGIPPIGLAGKVEVIRKSLALHAETIASKDPVAVLAALGGFEIAVMAGIILGGASLNLPVLIDGFIATAAFVAARELAPEVTEYCFFSHASAESGHALVMEKIGQRPYLDFGLRLGEGTGAALLLPFLRAAASMYTRMATFDSAKVSRVP